MTESPAADALIAADPAPAPSVPAPAPNSQDAKIEKLTRVFGANAPAVREILTRIPLLTPDEVGALALHWKPSMTFLTAQAQAWKTARRLKLNKPADAAYNAAYFFFPREHADWYAAANVAAHAALGRALAGRLAPEYYTALTAGYDETIKALPAPGARPKIRVRKAAAAD